MHLEYIDGLFDGLAVLHMKKPFPELSTTPSGEVKKTYYFGKHLKKK